MAVRLMSEALEIADIVPYRNLSKSVKESVDKLLIEYCSDLETLHSVQASLDEFDDDVVMILAAVGDGRTKGTIKEGLWDALISLIQKRPGVDITAAVDVVEKPKQKRKPKAIPTSTKATISSPWDILSGGDEDEPVAQPALTTPAAVTPPVETVVASPSPAVTAVPEAPTAAPSTTPVVVEPKKTRRSVFRPLWR